jgi:P-type E1-E2 ATPase
VSELHRLGVEAAMITGDNWGVARSIAAEVGIDTVLAEVLPEHKTAEVALVVPMSSQRPIPADVRHHAQLEFALPSSH